MVTVGLPRLPTGVTIRTSCDLTSRLAGPAGRRSRHAQGFPAVLFRASRVGIVVGVGVGAADRHAVRRGARCTRRRASGRHGHRRSSPALIGGARTIPTGETGAYQFTGLPPGTYTVAYELTGFTPLKREGVVVQVAQTTRLDVELGRRHAAGNRHRERRIAGRRRQLDGHADQHHQGSVRSDSDRAAIRG